MRFSSFLMSIRCFIKELKNDFWISFSPRYCYKLIECPWWPCVSAARKLKKIGQQKNPEEDHPAQEHFESVQNVSPKPGPSFNSQVVFINILESIEPEVVNAGHDYCQPDSAATLLTSLNELGERQLVKVVKWAKGLPGRRPSTDETLFFMLIFPSQLMQECVGSSGTLENKDHWGRRGFHMCLESTKTLELEYKDRTHETKREKGDSSDHYQSFVSNSDLKPLHAPSGSIPKQLWMHCS